MNRTGLIFCIVMWGLYGGHASGTLLKKKQGIYSTATLDILWQGQKYLNNTTLVIFDIDKVLLTGVGTMARGTKEQRRSLKNMLKPLTRSHRHRVRSKAILNRDRMLVDERTPELIDNLQKKGVPVMALTMCIAGAYKLIPKLEDVRLAELQQFGFDFSRSFPALGSFSLSNVTYKQRHPFFKSGVLFASNCDKGVVLEHFLTTLSWVPSRVIFVDNKVGNLISVKNILKNRKIPFLGIHYTAASKIPGAFNKKLAEFQMKYLIEHEELLNDEQAQALMCEV